MFSRRIIWLLGVVLLLGACDRVSTLLSRERRDGSADVIIVGAGLAGLSTAYRLEKAGISTLLLEAEPRVGGRIRTPVYGDGASAEAGLEEFWGGNATLEIARELGIPLSEYHGSMSGFRYQGRIYSPGPHRTNGEFVKSFLPPAQAEAFSAWDELMQGHYESVMSEPRAATNIALESLSFAEWVRTTSGLSEMAQQFVRITSEPEYGTSWERISALDGIVEWHVFSGRGSAMYHVQGGNTRVVEAMADHVGWRSIHLNHQVTHIAATEDGVEVRATDTTDFSRFVARGKYVVTTAPLFRLHDIQFEPSLSDERQQAIATQTWGAYFTAHVLLDAPYGTVAAGLLEDAALPLLSDGPLGVIYPSKSKHLLNLLVHGDYAERFNLRTLDPGSIRAELAAAFDELSPGLSDHIEQMVFYRYHPRAIASWPVGRSRFDELSNSLRQPQGRVYFAGDFTEGSHSDGAAESAIRVAREIIAAEAR